MMNRIIAFFVLLASCMNYALAQNNLALNRACYQSGSAGYDNVAHLTTDGHNSTYWQSKAGNEEWIYVDLGQICDVSGVKIAWGDAYAANYKIQVSTSGSKEKPGSWKDVYSTIKGRGGEELAKFAAVKAKYVRVLCLKSSTSMGYRIQEFEVSGRGAKTFASVPLPARLSDGRQYLTGGNWKLLQKSFVNEEGAQLSQPIFDDKNWIPATVPGTVLSNYLNIGAIPDPYFGDQQLMISEKFFTADFWYRTTFSIPESYQGNFTCLNFDGINWKADVYFNGILIGKIEGAFRQTSFDITPYVKIGSENALAVLIRKNDNPGLVSEQHLKDPDANGGIIGLDSPTFLAAIGWNWMPTIRGRNTGIWNNVFLSSTGSASIKDPFIRTDLPLPDTSRADLSVELTLQNNSNNPVNGILKIEFNTVIINLPVSLKPLESKLVSLTKNTHPELVIQNPALWWPNGYGKPNLNSMKLSFSIENEVSDEKEVEFGIRKYTYSYDNNLLRLHINGVPLIIRGGNWGMPDAMLRCDGDGYDLRVRLHKEMNLNMIRNWIGMSTNELFYRACDKYGIMVFDDFWLANPVDGPAPLDNNMFRDNVESKLLQFRNHACIAIWAGRNEGYPPAVLDSVMRNEVSAFDDTRHYISSSAHAPVTGLGPYETKDPNWYFANRGFSLHTEQGIVCVPPVESMREMMPAENLWPVNDMWGKHDWTQPRVEIYTNDLNEHYGLATGIEDFCRKAQMMNMEGPKAMMETWQSNRGPGVIVWMTHPAWPSLICQTYDYYFEPSAAYFAFKTGSEPLHILWRSDNNKIQVANNTLTDRGWMKAVAELYDLSGQRVYSQEINKEVPANSMTDFITLAIPETISNVHFIRLQLMDKNGNVVSRNFYWNSKQYQHYTDLNLLPQVEVRGEATISKSGEKSIISVQLENESKQIGLMLRLKVKQSKSGKRVLPAFYSDNYISLVPGEKRSITIEFDTKFLDGEKPALLIEGWNIRPKEISIR